jgi:murein DD-endopeptidase MepM/ murein hydrolase activator NlpD
MYHDLPSARAPRVPRLLLVVGVAIALALAAAAGWARTGPAPMDAPPPMLAAARANTMAVDTLLIGGYARGTFGEALRVVASDLSDGEREMVGSHLDRIFEPLLDGEGLRRGGRLRVAYERTRRHDGSTRAIQVLAAQAAVSGGMHTVFVHEDADGPAYFDDMGRSLDAGAWVQPLASLRVTSGFRMDRMHPILRRVLPHLGVDYGAPYGSPVHATADGSVSFAGGRGGYGNLVEIQHPNGYSTRYAHLSRITVRQHQAVRQGDVIGHVGMTGLATGPHLHYEVRLKGTPVDPALVTALQPPLKEVAFDLEWREQRNRLSALLARTPTVVRSARP